MNKEENAYSESAEKLSHLVEDGEIAEAVLALDRLSQNDKASVLTELDPTAAADLVEHSVDASALEILNDLPADVAASILDEIPSDHRADLISGLPNENASAIIEQLPAEDAVITRKLLEYASDTAGGLMVAEFLWFESTLSVGDVIADLQQNADKYRNYEVQYTYVCETGRLLGVLPLRDLLLTPQTARVTDVMIANPASIDSHMPIEEIDEFFDSNSFLGVPVVDEGNRLLGVVQRLAVEKAKGDNERSDYLKSQGIVGGEEVRSLPLWIRSKKRLSWLSVNIVLNILAASVIAFFQETLEAVIALAVFLPIISDMSGCSGNQAVAVSMRELSLGLIRPDEHFRVWLKEVSLGIVNGAALGILIALSALLWKGDWMLGFVVGTALTLNTIIAVSFGGTVPLILKRLGVDPAIASGPLLTTITDMCGFFLVLALAAALLV